MANTLGFYNPNFYANEALIHLFKALGMARRVHMGYDAERRGFGKGEFINIKSPSTFVAADAPSTAADLNTKSLQLQLAYWREVKFKLTDKELAFTTEKIIDDHIIPAAYTLADDIDQKLVALIPDVPHVVGLTYDGGTPTAAIRKDVINPRKTLFNNNAPVNDIGRLHYMVDGGLEADLLDLPAFSQQQGAGDTGVNTQMRGTLGTKYGLEVFANQNVSDTTAGSTSVTGALTPDVAVVFGDTTITFSAATTLTGTMEDGDVITITEGGITDKYAVPAGSGTQTAAGNTLTDMPISPAARRAYTTAAVITIETQTDYRNNIAFHRNCFALAMAPLSDKASELGALVATVTDPVTALSIRSRIYYVGNSSEVHVALDVLFGVRTLDPDLGARGVEDLS